MDSCIDQQVSHVFWSNMVQMPSWHYKMKDKSTISRLTSLMQLIRHALGPHFAHDTVAALPLYSTSQGTEGCNQSPDSYQHARVGIGQALPVSACRQAINLPLSNKHSY